MLWHRIFVKASFHLCHRRLTPNRRPELQLNHRERRLYIAPLVIAFEELVSVQVVKVVQLGPKVVALLLGIVGN